MMCLGIYFFGFIFLFSLKFIQLFESVDLLPNCENFSAIPSLSTFLALSCFSSLSGMPMNECRSFVRDLQFLEALFQSVFSLFRLSNFCGSALQFTDSFLFSIVLSSPSSELFTSVIVFVSILFFFVLSVSLLMLSIFFQLF